MKQLQLVNPAYVHQVWGEIKHLFEASCESCTTGDINADQLKAQLAVGAQTLFVITNAEGAITGAASVELINLPNHRIAQITGLGGRDIVGTETFSQFEDWAKSQGATKIRAWAKEPQARLYKKVGLDAAMIVVEKTL